jgi:septal ring factor EnvC (AmiA/AmiB activator)
LLAASNFCRLLCVLFFFTSTCALEAADNGAQTEADLAVVNAAIADIQGWLIEAGARQSQAQKNLRDADKNSATAAQTAATAQALLDATKSELATLQLRINQLESDKTRQSALLGQSLRAAYMAGDQSALKLLLNQQDLSRSTRLLHYHRLFAASRLEKIESFQRTLADISSAKLALGATAEDLGRQQSELEQNLLTLQAANAQRVQALSDLSASIGSRSSELEQLQVNQSDLEALLQQIAEAMARVQSVANLPAFTAQRGKLPLPADGPVISRFGSQYGEGALTRRGITIGVAEGTPVQAVHPGRIVFSDWLRGSGLLVIIDHGDGYMSLYGANQTLSKQAGDWVDAGDVLATSGVRGDNTAGVYFEIRHHGTAENPSSWLQN